MKRLYFIGICLWCMLLGLHSQDLQSSVQAYNSDSIRDKLSHSISKARIQKHLEILASDSMAGRSAGTIGEFMARDYITKYYIDKLALTQDKESLLQRFQLDDKHVTNIIASFPGDSLADEFIVVSAHYDHVGTDSSGEIYNGADDNASGTAAMMEMVRVMSIAYRSGFRPKRSVVFIHFTAEELGLWGSKYFVSQSRIPTSKFFTNLNLDMIGRVDRDHKKNPNYIYIVGANYFGKDLLNQLIASNQTSENLELNLEYNDIKHPERFHQRTDSFPFAANGVPFIFFTSGTHKDYHKPSDVANKIAYDPLLKRTRLIFTTLWDLANREQPLELDKTKVQSYKNKYQQFIQIKK